MLEGSVRRRVTERGYTEVFVEKGVANSGWRLEHRVIVSEIIGRALTAEEVVHHRDLQPSNNQPENLLLLSDEAIHLALHNLIQRGRYAEWRASERKLLAQMYCQPLPGVRVRRRSAAKPRPLDAAYGRALAYQPDLSRIARR